MPKDMPSEKKIPVGPLPPPKEDYTQYEETKVLWGRLALMFGGVFALAFAGLHTLFSPASDERVVSVIEQRRIAEQELVRSIQAPQTNAVVASVEEVAGFDSAPEKQRVAVVAGQQDDISEASSAPVTQGAEVTKSAPSEAPRAASLSNNDSMTPVSSVTTLHPGIRAATLASNVDAKRQPDNILGYEVPMNGEDLIKVVLHTQLQDIEGVTLYHEWHRGDKRYARVRIPVTSKDQGSYSSKFIDQHMTGEWSVQVRDEQGELYAMANFKVVR
ncbi:hypothetical protein A3742_04945 [Oleiphilus sp. HI0071]|nr:DUF2914 domain-containing protein [Oleiphilus sp. HI0080]KZY63697.1 hypothetical protein A3737_03145 [Oleiphilus sp. HI0065]KZY86527.1 hypothetical protein A3742_04945 [Oleiphilus sp. HI0071]KZZ06083.1 hypothetical protein A3744_07340 [Oleiphilus sp. HI0073]KZZ51359.1 hypothetical protein A3760_12605 [Oleiphilus sp. HI0122]KZZ51569.1 hypothetical protein A3758_12200 [Oleiphilus sp. HI0118]KZZ76011.1 hypothetical protein A3765_10130 [Oleiphilus sp. HI0130]KZZ76639.1 hypothetical protein A3